MQRLTKTMSDDNKRIYNWNVTSNSSYMPTPTSGFNFSPSPSHSPCMHCMNSSLYEPTLRQQQYEEFLINILIHACILRRNISLLPKMSTHGHGPGSEFCGERFQLPFIHQDHGCGHILLLYVLLTHGDTYQYKI